MSNKSTQHLDRWPSSRAQRAAAARLVRRWARDPDDETGLLDALGLLDDDDSSAAGNDPDRP